MKVCRTGAVPRALADEQPVHEAVQTIPPQARGYCLIGDVVHEQGFVTIPIAVRRCPRFTVVRLRLPWDQADELWRQLGAVLGR